MWQTWTCFQNGLFRQWEEIMFTPEQLQRLKNVDFPQRINGKFYGGQWIDMPTEGDVLIWLADYVEGIYPPTKPEKYWCISFDKVKGQKTESSMSDYDLCGLLVRAVEHVVKRDGNWDKNKEKRHEKIHSMCQAVYMAIGKNGKSPSNFFLVEKIGENE